MLLCNIVNAAKIIIKSVDSPSDALFENDNFIFSKDVKDTKQPTLFSGDVMKAKTKQNINERTKDKNHNA